MTTWIKKYDDDQEDLFRNSCKFYSMMADLGLAPEIIRIDKDTKIIETRKYLNSCDKEYKEFVRSNNEIYCSKVNEKIEKLISMNICHGDLDCMNIVMQLNGSDNIDIFFIDWDYTFDMTDKSKHNYLLDFYELYMDRDPIEQFKTVDMEHFSFSLSLFRKYYLK